MKNGTEFKLGSAPPTLVLENISPYKIPGDSTSGLLPKISKEPPGEYGTADNKIQAYCFRLCMTNNDDNRNHSQSLKIMILHNMNCY